MKFKSEWIGSVGPDAPYYYVSYYNRDGELRLKFFSTEGEREAFKKANFHISPFESISPTFSKFDVALMKTAHIWAECSHSTRKKVGCVLAMEDRCISHGYNGREQSQDNSCEDSEGNTRTDVIHAELNAILFAAKHGISLKGVTLYVTCTPCRSCVPMIAAAGITKVIFHEDYVSSSKGTSLEELKKYNIEVLQIPGDYL